MVSENKIPEPFVWENLTNPENAVNRYNLSKGQTGTGGRIPTGANFY